MVLLIQIPSEEELLAAEDKHSPCNVPASSGDMSYLPPWLLHLPSSKLMLEDMAVAGQPYQGRFLVLPIQVAIKFNNRPKCT